MRTDIETCCGRVHGRIPAVSQGCLSLSTRASAWWRRSTAMFSRSTKRAKSWLLASATKLVCLMLYP